MTATHEEDNRRWIRMSRYPFVDSLRHVVSAFLFLWIIVTLLLNGESPSSHFLFLSFLTSGLNNLSFVRQRDKT